MVRKTISNSIVEQSKFWVPAQVKPRRGKRRGNTSPRKQDENGELAIRQLARVLNCNFSRGDFLLTLKYDEAGMERIGGDRDEGERQLFLCLRRMARAFKAAGYQQMPRVAMTSEKDEETGEVVRLHHHLVISGAAFSLREGILYLGKKPMDAVWGFGTVDWQGMRQGDKTPLAVYLCRQARCGENEKKWTTSQHLKKPIISERIAKPGELKVPAGAATLQNGNYDPETGTHYIRYRLPEPKERSETASGGGRKVGRRKGEKR
ncbi:MAG: hypothetical protein RR426_05465 [Oscillospiraceae bacterium]